MKATVLDLRRSTKKILDAIARNETVTLSHRGKAIARIEPIESEPPRCREPNGVGLVEDIDVDDFVLEPEAQALYER